MDYVVLYFNKFELGRTLGTNSFSTAVKLMRELAEEVLDDDEMKTYDACVDEYYGKCTCFGYTFEVGVLEDYSKFTG